MEKKLVLFKANWCIHCNDFTEEWNAIKELSNKNNIKTIEYEDTNNEDKKIIEKSNIQGYPTLRIYYDETNYKDLDTNVDSIINELGLNNIQSGGGNVNYYNKYIKYKNKYINLKKNN